MESFDKVSRALFAYTRHTRDTVRGIALYSLDIYKLRGSNAVDLHYLCFVIYSHLGLAEFSGCYPYGNRGRNELEAVPVSCCYHTFVSALCTGMGKRTQNIISLKALTGHYPVAEVGEQFFQRCHLLGKLIGHSLAVRFIAVIGLMPECRRFEVKCHGNGIGSRFIKQSSEGSHKPVYRIGKYAVLCGKELYSIIRSVKYTVTVKYQKFHQIPPCRVFRDYSLYNPLCPHFCRVSGKPAERAFRQDRRPHNLWYPSFQPHHQMKAYYCFRRL